ncbi:MAG: GntR family transcriptional regulator [Ahrensia sp.]
MLRSKTVKPDRPLPLARQVYEELHQRILRFELKPYQVLSEASVSEMLGVSRTPAREALTKLAESKFVDVVPQRGSQVAPLRMEDLERSQFMREALEVALLRRALASGDTVALIKGLRKEITLQRTYVNFEDTESFYASDEKFHGLIAHYAKQPSVLPEILRLKEHMDRFRHLMVSGVEDLDNIIRQHVAIADAIEAGNAPQAEKHMIRHLRRIFDYIGHAREKFPDYFEMQSDELRASR